MKKKLFWMLLALMLLTLPALADADLKLPGSASVWVNGTFYSLNTPIDSQVDVMMLQPEQDAPQVLCSVPGVPDYVMPEDYTPEMKEAVPQTISQLFVNNGQLYAINYLVGKAGPVDAQGAHWADVQLDMGAYFEDGNLVAHRSGFAQDGIYYVPIDAQEYEASFEKMHLLATDLVTGQTTTIKPDNAQGFAPYVPGKLLALRAVKARDTWRWQLAEMDAATGAMTALPMELPEASPEVGSGIGGIGYDPDTDTYFYATAQKLMMSQGKQPFVLTAVLPFDYMQADSARTFVLPGGQYALTRWGDITVRDVGEAIDLKHSLNFQTGWHIIPTPEAFIKAHPDAAVFKYENIRTAEQAGMLIQSGDTENDLFLLHVDPALRALIDKGYAKPFENEMLVKDFATLYPAVQQVLCDKQGRPCAWPVDFHWSAGQIQDTAWKKYFGDEPYPTTFGELFDYMLRFTAMEEGDDPEAYFLFAMEYDHMVRMVVDAYIRQYEQPGEALAFDRPALRDALDKLARAHSIMAAGGAKPQDFEGESSGDPRNVPSLVHPFSGGGLFNIPDSFGEVLNDIPPFTFEKGETPVQRADMYVMMINPRSPKAELAEQFIAGWLDVKTDPILYYAIHPKASEPYPNPNFEEHLQRTRDDLKLYSEKLKEAQDSGAPAEEIQIYSWRVQLAEQNLREQDRLKYMIPKEGIERFRQRAPLIAFDDRLLLMSDNAQEQMESLRTRYVGGELTLDGYLDAMTQVARLVYLESK